MKIPLLMITCVTAGTAFSFAPLPRSTKTIKSSTVTNLLNNDNSVANEDTDTDSRRKFLATVTAAFVTGVSLPGDAAWASGGATAGKYTTIPIAKRRYYGRVQQGVHDFLLMGPAVVAGEIKSAPIQDFFDPQGVVVVEARRQSINGQCTKKDASCKGAEVRDSRYNDMKTSMYLLSNAFRINQTKAPDNLPSVRSAKAFFKEMDNMEKLVTAKKKKDPKDVAASFLAALDILDVFLDLVELPPTDSGHYDKSFSTLVGESARIT